MPSKKKKYNSRFPPARIKKIMQSNEDVGKVASVVPVIMSRALEKFVQSLLHKSATVTRAKNARTLTPAHLKQSILSDNQFEFLKSLVSVIPDVGPGGEEEIDMTQTMAQVVERVQRRSNKTPSGNTQGTGRGRGRPRKQISQEKQIEQDPIVEEDPDEETEEDEEEEEDSCDNDNDNQQLEQRQSQENRNQNNNGLIQPSLPSRNALTVSQAGPSNLISEDDDYDN